MATNRLKTKLLPKQRKLIKVLSEGKNIQEASKIVGYNPSYVSTLLRKAKMIDALDKAGLTDGSLAKSLKTAIESGLSVKPTNSDALSGLRLAYELKGGLTKDKPESMTQNNLQIIQLRNMDDNQLSQKIQELTSEIAKLSVE